MDTRDLRTVKQLAEELKDTGTFSESMLRFLIKRQEGVAACVVRVGKHLLIDRRRFNDWVETRRQAQAAPRGGGVR